MPIRREYPDPTGTFANWWGYYPRGDGVDHSPNANTLTPHGSVEVAAKVAGPVDGTQATVYDGVDDHYVGTLVPPVGAVNFATMVSEARPDAVRISSRLCAARRRAGSTAITFCCGSTTHWRQSVTKWRRPARPRLERWLQAIGIASRAWEAQTRCGRCTSRGEHRDKCKQRTRPEYDQHQSWRLYRHLYVLVF